MPVPFITRLPVQADIAQVLLDLEHVLAQVSWEPHNQIGLRMRAGAAAPWHDAAGKLMNNGTDPRTEADFVQWCPGLPAYTRGMLEALAASHGVSWGRIRFMRCMPKQGLTMHRDPERRYHLVLDTNPNAIVAQGMGGAIRCMGYHLPRDGHWYLVDTCREHFVYNGGQTPRIHLVANPLP